MAVACYRTTSYNVGMKYCWVCKQEKPLSEFYKDKHRPDGYGQKCKDCDRIFRRGKRKRNPDTYKKRDARYYQAHREQKLQYLKEWREKNVQKSKAHLLVRQALRSGELERQPCAICGSLNSDAHHEDYRKPLEVMWLCRTHHVRYHS